MTKLTWQVAERFDGTEHYRMFYKGVLLASFGIDRFGPDRKWVAEFGPSRGIYWDTREQAQAAVSAALHSHYAGLLESLPDPPLDEIKAGDWVKLRIDKPDARPMKVFRIGAFGNEPVAYLSEGFWPLADVVKVEAPHVS